MSATMNVRRADHRDIEAVSGLYDAYRQFYGMASELAQAREYVLARMENAEAVVFVAEQDERIVGFTQLYPSFCSVFMEPIIVLYDLFVHPDTRQRGIGRLLLTAAAEYADAQGALRMDLKTGRTNKAAQTLYESMGWTRNDMFYDYNRMPVGTAAH